MRLFNLGFVAMLLPVLALTLPGGAPAQSCEPVLSSATTSVSEVDDCGTLETDQSAATGSEVDESGASVFPRSVDGQPVGSYTTEVAEPEEILSARNVQVITSTASGTSALTGVVIDDATGAPVINASVSLQPSAGGTATTTTTNADGLFAYINIPAATAGTRYNLTVTAAGFGRYDLLNGLYERDETYDATVLLTTAQQSYDESLTAGDTTQTAGAATNPPYASPRRVPPTIIVGHFTQTSTCAQTGNLLQTKRWPWRFYVLHVAIAEISTLWKITAWKANAAAQQNFAWYFTRHPKTSSYDLTNTTSDQCFRPERRVPRSWKRWIGDVLDERVATSSGEVQQTFYRAGTYKCTESLYPADGNKLSQNGSRARDDKCGVDNWRNLIHYYYTGTVEVGRAPPAPKTSFSQVSGGVKLNFPSRVSDGAGHTSNVGWKYTAEAYKRLPDGTFAWTVIYKKGWDQSSRSVPTSFTYNNPGGCWKYRAKGHNPVGVSSYAGFNNGSAICPG
jgi:hypothetical protein